MPTSDEKLFNSWRWRVFAATWASYAGYYFARKPFSIVKASLEKEFAWDTEMLGTLGAAYLVAYTVGQFLAGAGGQRWGPRVMLLAGMMVSLLANAALGFTNSFGTFATLMALNGLCQATGWSNNVGTMGQWFRREERGRVMGFWATNYQVGGVLANTLAAFTLGNLGFRWSFFSGSLVLLAVWAFVLLNQRNGPEDVGLPPIEDEAPSGHESTETVPSPSTSWPRAIVINIAIIGVFYFFVKFIRYALWSWAPYLLETSFGLAGDDAGYVSTIFDLAGIAGVIVLGWLSDNVFKQKRALPALLSLFGLSASCVLLYYLGPTSVMFFAVSMGLIGFTLYGPDALMTGAGAIDVGAARRATMAAGIINGMGSCGAVVQEFVLGSMLKRLPVQLTFGALLGASVLAALALAVLVVRGRHGESDV